MLVLVSIKFYHISMKNNDAMPGKNIFPITGLAGIFVATQRQV